MKFIVILLFLMSTVLTAQNHIIPAPASYQSSPDTFRLKSSTGITTAGNITEARGIVNQFIGLPMVKGLKLTAKSTASNINFEILSTPDPGIGDEGYELTVNADGINLKANKAAGLF